MSATAFDSFPSSAFGAFVRSPLGVRGASSSICYLDLDGTNGVFAMSYNGNDLLHSNTADANANPVVAFRSFQDETGSCTNMAAYPIVASTKPIGICHYTRVSSSCSLSTTDIEPERTHFYVYESAAYTGSNNWGEIYRTGFGFGIFAFGNTIYAAISPNGLLAYVPCVWGSAQDALPSTSCSGFSPALPSDVDSVHDRVASGAYSSAYLMFKRTSASDAWTQHTEYPYLTLDVGVTGAEFTLGEGGRMWAVPFGFFASSSLSVYDALTDPAVASMTTLTTSSGTWTRVFHSATVTLATQSNGDVRIYSGTTLIQTLSPGSGTVSNATECDGWLALQRGGTLYWYKWNSGTSQYDSHSSSTAALGAVRVMKSNMALENGRQVWTYSAATDTWTRDSYDLRDDLEATSGSWVVYKTGDNCIWWRNTFFTRAAFRRF